MLNASTRVQKVQGHEEPVTKSPDIKKLVNESVT